MGTRASRWHDQQGFTLVELMIAIAITGLIVSAIAGALIVSFATTGVTQQRLAESHDVQITSAFLANDVQSATAVNPASGGTCSGASTPLVTFAYADKDGGANGNAVYACGTAANGETQVTRTFHGDSVVLAHFAGAARPTVTCAPNAGCGGTVNSVTMAFTEASGYSYTLVGSRRGISSGGSGTGSPPGDVTVLSTGTSSPLWVQGGCPDPGTSAACAIDPNLTALPVSDVLTTGWTTNPASPNTLWDKLNDQSDSTWATTATKDKEARVALSPVDPPDGTPVTVEVRAMSVGTGAAKMKVSVYDLTSGPAALATQTINNVNSLKNYDWTASGIPTASYAHLTLGFSLTTNGDTVTVYGVAVDTASPSGLLTIKGSLTINSTSSSAVKLSGSKTGTQITIAPGDFRILQGGACTGCNHSTVSCAGCSWSGNQPWTSYSPSLPDPLRSLAAPAQPANGGCSGSVCSPGYYAGTLSRTANTTLNPGIYYLNAGISVTGSASLTCPAPCSGGVMLYVAGGSMTLAGGSTIDLPAPSSGTYKGIVVFQARNISSPVKIAGNAGSSTPISFGGIIYVPNSTQVTLATGTATLTAKAIVAQNIKVSSPVTIG
jgi:prepilin-type N-terminal cleavage/methylation domain-containing protein